MVHSQLLGDNQLQEREMSQENNLEDLYQRICHRNDGLKTHARKFTEEISTNFAEFKTYSIMASSVIECLKAEKAQLESEKADLYTQLATAYYQLEEETEKYRELGSIQSYELDEANQSLEEANEKVALLQEQLEEEQFTELGPRSVQSYELEEANKKVALLEEQFQEQGITMQKYVRNLAKKDSMLQKRNHTIDELKQSLKNSKQHHEELSKDHKAKLEQLEQINNEILGEMEYQKLKHKEEMEAQQLKHKEDLTPYVLTDVEPLRDSTFADGGAYGSVSLVRLKGGVICIEKRIQDFLIGYGRNAGGRVSEEEKRSIEERFRKECVFLSQMHHPNIVQFMGVCYSKSNSLSLIMEYLPTSLDKCITRCYKTFSIPLSYKFSILLDVSCGLLYLHQRGIVHRDLTAANVLLTSDLRAKIADLGMSRILTPEEMRKNVRLTKAPGAPHIMPPEASGEDPQYSFDMDIFAFGILILHLILQECPDNLDDRGITQQHLEKKEMEIGKRIRYIKKVTPVCEGNSKMETFIRACLQDLPERRPTVEELRVEFEQLCSVHPKRHKDAIEMLQTINRMEKGQLPPASKLRGLGRRF